MRLRATRSLSLSNGGFKKPFIVTTAEIQALFTQYGCTNGALYDCTNPATLWQDTTATTAVTAFGQPIGRISDISGFGNHQIQATATARPLWQANGASFDGIDDFTACTLSTATNQNHYLARSFVVDGWTGSTSIPGHFNLYLSSTVFLHQGGRADSPTSGRSLNTSYRYGSTPPQTTASVASANYVAGVLNTGESIYIPNTSVNVSLGGAALITSPFTGNVANSFTSIGFRNATVATLFAKTERRAIWMPGVTLTATDRAKVRAWLRGVL